MTMEINGVIYKATNKFTNMVYIGATIKSIDERILDHIQKSNNDYKNRFQEAISTYSPEAFIWEQIDTANNPNELAEKEKYYILEYNAKEEGYNADSGGGMKKTIYQYDSDGSFIAKYNSLEGASDVVSAYKTCVGNACIGQNKTCKGYYWSYNLYDKYPLDRDARKKKVLQLELDGTLTGKFDSVSEASKATGISKTCIARVCRGEREQTSGFIFKYA